MNADKAFYRRIVAIPEAGVVRAALEDEVHHMEVAVFHDGARITEIKSLTHRAPWNLCPGAGEKLRDLIGVPLQRMHTSTGLDAKEHCTHLFDLVRLAVARAFLNTPVQYDATVPDRADTNGPGQAELLLDGESVLRWEFSGFTVTGPAPFTGHNILGPPKWNPALDDDAIEAGLILRRSVFVSGVRDPWASKMMKSWSDDEIRQGLKDRGSLGHCFTYRLPRLDAAIPTRTQQDYAGRQDHLLAGFPGARAVADMTR